jgi:hypothetical protein
MSLPDILAKNNSFLLNPLNNGCHLFFIYFLLQRLKLLFEKAREGSAIDAQKHFRAEGRPCRCPACRRRWPFWRDFAGFPILAGKFVPKKLSSTFLLIE